MDILFPASSGIGPGKYSQSGTDFLLKHLLEDTDRLPGYVLALILNVWTYSLGASLSFHLLGV